MKFHSDRSGDELRITGYGAEFVVVGERRIESSFFIDLQGVQPLPAAPTLETLAWDSLTWLHDAPPEVVLLGTGRAQRFPPLQLFRDLAARRIGLEAMSTPAACRTFNILLSEGRNVAAVMLLD